MIPKAVSKPLRTALVLSMMRSKDFAWRHIYGKPIQQSRCIDISLEALAAMAGALVEVFGWKKSGRMIP
jgi:hypothetical protein